MNKCVQGGGKLEQSKGAFGKTCECFMRKLKGRLSFEKHCVHPPYTTYTIHPPYITQQIEARVHTHG